MDFSFQNVILYFFVFVNLYLIALRAFFLIVTFHENIIVFNIIIIFIIIIFNVFRGRK